MFVIYSLVDHHGRTAIYRMNTQTGETWVLYSAWTRIGEPAPDAR